MPEERQDVGTRGGAWLDGRCAEQPAAAGHRRADYEHLGDAAGSSVDTAGQQFHGDDRCTGCFQGDSCPRILTLAACAGKQRRTNSKPDDDDDRRGMSSNPRMHPRQQQINNLLALAFWTGRLQQDAEAAR